MRRSICALVVLLVMVFSSTVESQFGDPVPRYPQEMDGPVNMKNRSLYFSETDLAIPGRGLGIEFTRHYNSAGIHGTTRGTSYIGPKWNHSYQWEVRFSGSRSGYYQSWNSETNSYTSVWSPFTVTIITGGGAKQSFTASGSNLNSAGWESRATFTPKDGVRARLKLVQSGEKWAYVYTTRHGISYKFDTVESTESTKQVLTEISDANGNRVKLHYDAAPESRFYRHRYPRLAAVEDTLGRILKFSYDYSVDDVAFPRFITKIEFGLGTSTALTTVYNTVEYGYARYRRYPYYRTSSYVDCLSAVTHQLGADDPRGSEVKTQYEYGRSESGSPRDFGHLIAVISPLGYRTEYRVHDRKVSSVRARDVADYGSDEGTVLYERLYSTPYTNSMTVYSKNPVDRTDNTRRRYNRYRVSTGHITEKYYGWRLPDYYSWRWSYANANVTSATHYDLSDRQRINGTYYNRRRYFYRIQYAGENATHNRRMGNATKWEQFHSSYRTTSDVARKWEADYETTYNRPIWQIDPMGHRTEFSYDSKGNLTEQRSKANTGTQPHAVDHDIITTHQYDTYGNRIKTIFMPGTTQEKVVETVYDSTKHTYPIEVKTTVTVNGADHTIKTKSEWDVNRGWKTADIDAQGMRTEYAYWKDGKLKYTRRVADNLYTVPTYDKNGRVIQTQVRQTNWQTGTLIAQTKTEYDAMGRVTKAHSFNNDDWATPYATTESMYDVFGDLSQTKDPRGLLTTYTRDFIGRVTKQTLPDGDWVETRYNSIDQVTKAWTSQTGSETSPAASNNYDNLNRISQVSYSTGETVSYTYDLGNNVLTQATNDGSETYTYTFTHDQLNRVITKNNSLLGYKTFYEYDDASMRTRMSIRPSSGGTKVYDATYTYDEANRLLSVNDAITAKAASYGYYDIGALKTVKTPNGITAHRTLDTFNRLDTLQYRKDASKVLSSLDYDYDVKSNVTQLVRKDTGTGGKNKTFSFCYDNLSRLTTANYGDGLVFYAYDQSGNRLVQASSIDGTTTYTVAADSNQLAYRSLVPEDEDFSTLSYTYDAEGKLTQRGEGTDADTFSYGFGSQLTRIQKTRGGTLQQTISYAYDGGGKRVKVTDGQGTRYFLYDGLMPLLELDANKKVAASYLYGADGVVYRRKHKTAVAHWHFDEGKGGVAHDIDGRADGALGDGNADKSPAWSTERGGSLLFDGANDSVKIADSDALDLVGNSLTLTCWVKRSSAGSGYLIKKSDASNGYQLWITRDGKLQFQVLINGTTHTYTGATTLPLNTWKHVTARYNGRRLRILIDGTLERKSTVVTSTLAATAAPLWLGYYDDTNHHLHGYLDDVSIYNRALTDGEIRNLIKNRAGRYEYHHTNALGSNIIITDGGAGVKARYYYDAFGAVRSEVGTTDNTRKFTGKEYESDVKLYYYSARYYDPYIGRFTQRDPASDGINWYAYAYNNPLGFIDPTGLINRLATDAELETLRGAANFSFGESNANILMNFATIQFATRDEGPGMKGQWKWWINTMQIYVDDINNVELDVKRLGTFVHELTHAWQDIDMTGYIPPEGAVSANPDDRYEHTVSQLYYLQLDSEQMARSVQEHYVAIHGGPEYASQAFAWWNDYTGTGNSLGAKLTRQQLVNMASSGLYTPLLNMIRAPILKATTLGGIKGGL